MRPMFQAVITTDIPIACKNEKQHNFLSFFDFQN